MTSTDNALARLRRLYPNSSDATLREFLREDRMTYKQRRAAALRRRRDKRNADRIDIGESPDY